jgi:hypothetical protein
MDVICQLETANTIGGVNKSVREPSGLSCILVVTSAPNTAPTGCLIQAQSYCLLIES